MVSIIILNLCNLFINSVHKKDTCKTIILSTKMKEKSNVPIKQVNEGQRFKERANSDIVLPDYIEVSVTLKRIRTKTNKTCKYSNIHLATCRKNEERKGLALLALSEQAENST